MGRPAGLPKPLRGLSTVCAARASRTGRKHPYFPRSGPSEMKNSAAVLHVYEPTGGLPTSGLPAGSLPTGNIIRPAQSVGTVIAVLFLLLLIAGGTVGIVLGVLRSRKDKE